MPAFRDLTGQSFGRLRALERAPNKGRHTSWLCLCGCSTHTTVSAYALLSGNTRSCGCLKSETTSQRRLHDLTGQKFGRLTVISRAQNNKRGHVRWLCQCECGGKRTVVAAGDLQSEHIRSCGCSRNEAHETRVRDLTGIKFGHLTVLARASKLSHLKQPRIAWHAQCECGRELVVSGNSLVTGARTSCGCARGRHRMTRTKAYRAYLGAKRRCTNPNDKGFYLYGERGIQFLFTSFERFFAELGECPPGMTLGRKNNEGHYAPGNCRWERPRPQANNRRSNRHLTAFGVTHTMATWARMLNIDPNTLWSRLEAGWPVEKALSHVRVPPSAIWMMETVPASETYSATDSWEWRPYVPDLFIHAYAIEAA